MNPFHYRKTLVCLLALAAVYELMNVCCFQWKRRDVFAAPTLTLPHRGRG